MANEYFDAIFLLKTKRGVKTPVLQHVYGEVPKKEITAIMGPR
jgi:ABC-type multidrug transport system ATPase subunit